MPSARWPSHALSVPSTRWTSVGHDWVRAGTGARVRVRIKNMVKVTCTVRVRVKVRVRG